MKYAVCCVPVCPMRAEAAHKSEMVSQLLFGECAEVVAAEKYFIKIKCLYDGYEGWCQRSQLAVTDTLPAGAANTIYVSDWTDTVTINNATAHIPMGSPIIQPANTDLQVGPYKIRYQAGNPWSATGVRPTDEAIRQRAFRFLNTAYLWGGRSVFGIDCSGFTQLVFRFFNIPLLRDAYLQASQGEGIGFLQEARCGDLAFFDNAEGRITHVGILLNDHEIIHASGKVRVDRIDNAGIINGDTGERTHQLRLMRRYW
jgi:cell wall-associated NlpC family hydrolase